MKKIRLYLFLLIFVIFLTIFSLIFYSNLLNKKIFLYKINYVINNSTESPLNLNTFQTNNINLTLDNYFGVIQNNHGCKPMHENISEEYLTIDGVQYPKFKPIYLNKSINFKCLNKNKIKKILFWEKPPWYDNLKMILKSQNCPVTNCDFTEDRAIINESDLVLIHMFYKIDDPPAFRPPNQRWVFMNLESPIRTKKNLKKFNKFFNLTSTYMIDSDFPGYYDCGLGFIWKENKKFNENFDYFSNKTNFAAVIMSNCYNSGAPSNRMTYIQELKKYISVDIYGNCGQKCPYNPRKNTFYENCKEIISQYYKFYLAFENSICKDYITEKFFIVLNYNIIPVVLGGGSYDYYIPKSGYINALDFDSPKHLADYLDYLGKNKTAYNSYFKWKKYVTFGGFHKSPMCTVCIKLQLEEHFGIKKNTIDDIESYWSGKLKCKVPKFENNVFKV